jgi:HSP20 family protein
LLLDDDVGVLTVLTRSYMTSLFKQIFGSDFPDLNDAIDPALEGYYTDTSHVIEIEMPGIKKEQLSLKLKDRDLLISWQPTKPRAGDGMTIITGLNVTKPNKRQLRLPNGLNLDKINAKLEDGILRIEIERDLPTDKSKDIPIS